MTAILIATALIMFIFGLFIGSIIATGSRSDLELQNHILRNTIVKMVKEYNITYTLANQTIQSAEETLSITETDQT